jgi:hypothetical protein
MGHFAGNFGIHACRDGTMEQKSLQELRALAKARGLKGYSKLTKAELLKLLAKSHATASSDTKPATHTKNPAPRKATKHGPGQAHTTRAAKPGTEEVAAPATPVDTTTGDEERVEGSKYAVVPPGIGYAIPPVAQDLGEDIERLPTLREPMLCLLPQKPGVVHGYWLFPPGTAKHGYPLSLRLGQITGESFEVLEEIPVKAVSGHWYFHVDGTADHGAVFLQIGYYDASGRFVTAFHRGIARIPSLYASGRTDRLWWISDEQFRTMYLRSGGIVRGGKLGWKTSISSPAGPPGAPGVPTPWGGPSGGMSGR